MSPASLVRTARLITLKKVQSAELNPRAMAPAARSANWMPTRRHKNRFNEIAILASKGRFIFYQPMVTRAQPIILLLAPMVCHKDTKLLGSDLFCPFVTSCR